MANLTNCMECGGQLSRLARACPHCKTDHPHGEWCAVCTRVVKQSEAWTSTEMKWFHHRCYEMIKSDTIICPACHTQVNGSHVCQCPKCGHPFYIRRCYYCGLPVYSEKAKKWKPDEDTQYAHPLCASFSLRENKKCFIASAVCDPFADELLVLRSFRYYYLEQSPLGCLFLKMYMQLSPHIAKIISNIPWLCLLVRNLIVKPTAKIIECLFGRTILPRAKK